MMAEHHYTSDHLPLHLQFIVHGLDKIIEHLQSSPDGKSALSTLVGVIEKACSSQTSNVFLGPPLPPDIKRVGKEVNLKRFLLKFEPLFRVTCTKAELKQNNGETAQEVVEQFFHSAVADVALILYSAGSHDGHDLHSTVTSSDNPVFITLGCNFQEFMASLHSQKSVFNVANDIFLRESGLMHNDEIHSLEEPASECIHFSEDEKCHVDSSEIAIKKTPSEHRDQYFIEDDQDSVLLGAPAPLLTATSLSVSGSDSPVTFIQHSSLQDQSSLKVSALPLDSHSGNSQTRDDDVVDDHGGVKLSDAPAIPVVFTKEGTVSLPPSGSDSLGSGVGPAPASLEDTSLTLYNLAGKSEVGIEDIHVGGECGAVASCSQSASSGTEEIGSSWTWESRLFSLVNDRQTHQGISSLMERATAMRYGVPTECAVTIVKETGFFEKLLMEKLSAYMHPIIGITSSKGWLLVHFWEGESYAIDLGALSPGTKRDLAGPGTKVAGGTPDNMHKWAIIHSMGRVLGDNSILKVVYDTLDLSKLEENAGLKVVRVFDVLEADRIIRGHSSPVSLAELLHVYGMVPYSSVDIVTGSQRTPVREDIMDYCGKSQQEAISNLREMAQISSRMIPFLYQSMLSVMSAPMLAELNQRSNATVQSPQHSDYWYNPREGTMISGPVKVTPRPTSYADALEGMVKTEIATLQQIPCFVQGTESDSKETECARIQMQKQKVTSKKQQSEHQGEPPEQKQEGEQMELDTRSQQGGNLLLHGKKEKQQQPFDCSAKIKKTVQTTYANALQVSGENTIVQQMMHGTTSKVEGATSESTRMQSQDMQKQNKEQEQKQDQHQEHNEKNGANSKEQVECPRIETRRLLSSKASKRKKKNQGNDMDNSVKPRITTQTTSSSFAVTATNPHQKQKKQQEQLQETTQPGSERKKRKKKQTNTENKSAPPLKPKKPQDLLNPGYQRSKIREQNKVLERIVHNAVRGMTGIENAKEQTNLCKTESQNDVKLKKSSISGSSSPRNINPKKSSGNRASGPSKTQSNPPLCPLTPGVAATQVTQLKVKMDCKPKKGSITGATGPVKSKDPQSKQEKHQPKQQQNSGVKDSVEAESKKKKKKTKSPQEFSDYPAQEQTNSSKSHLNPGVASEKEQNQMPQPKLQNYIKPKENSVDGASGPSNKQYNPSVSPLIPGVASTQVPQLKVQIECKPKKGSINGATGPIKSKDPHSKQEKPQPKQQQNSEVKNSMDVESKKKKAPQEFSDNPALIPEREHTEYEGSHHQQQPTLHIEYPAKEHDLVANPTSISVSEQSGKLEQNEVKDSVEAELKKKKKKKKKKKSSQEFSYDPALIPEREHTESEGSHHQQQPTLHIECPAKEHDLVASPTSISFLEEPGNLEQNDCQSQDNVTTNVNTKSQGLYNQQQHTQKDDTTKQPIPPSPGIGATQNVNQVSNLKVKLDCKPNKSNDPGASGLAKTKEQTPSSASPLIPGVAASQDQNQVPKLKLQIDCKPKKGNITGATGPVKSKDTQSKEEKHQPKQQQNNEVKDSVEAESKEKKKSAQEFSNDPAQEQTNSSKSHLSPEVANEKEQNQMPQPKVQNDIKPKESNVSGASGQSKTQSNPSVNPPGPGVAATQIVNNPGASGLTKTKEQTPSSVSPIIPGVAATQVPQLKVQIYCKPKKGSIAGATGPVKSKDPQSKQEKPQPKQQQNSGVKDLVEAGSKNKKNMVRRRRRRRKKNSKVTDSMEAEAIKKKNKKSSRRIPFLHWDEQLESETFPETKMSTSPQWLKPMVLQFQKGKTPVFIHPLTELASIPINPCNITDELDEQFDDLLTSDAITFVEAFPENLQLALQQLSQESFSYSYVNLAEVVMDVGRKPKARYLKSGFNSELTEKVLNHDELTKLELQEILKDNSFVRTCDSQAMIRDTLHRIGLLANAQGEVIGMTAKVEHPLPGCLSPLYDVFNKGQSILAVGPTGVGKTTLLREAARVLSDVERKNVFVIDTFLEIAGEGDIPHQSIGSARRLQVTECHLQHKMMKESYQNHRPEIVIIDEISSLEDAKTALNMRLRGIQLIAGVNGQTLADVLLNTALTPINGGIKESCIEGHQGGQTVRLRTGPPVFDVLVEMPERERWLIHWDFTRAIDSLLPGGSRTVEVEERMVKLEEDDDEMVAQQVLAMQMPASYNIYTQ